MFKRLTWLLPILSLVLMSDCALASSNTLLTDAVYYPGYISYKTSLDLFSSSSLMKANIDLMNGNLTASAKSFADQIAREPNDLAAYVGLVQSSRGTRQNLFFQYQIDERKKPSLTNEFKLGLVSFYLYGEGLKSSDPNGKNQLLLGSIARKKLQKAYDMNHAPIIGFILADALNYTPGSSSVLPVFEGMLKELGGTTLYQEYTSAKNSGWNTTLPEYNGTKKNMLLLARIVSNLRSQNSMTVGTVEETVMDGKRVVTFGPGTFKPEQQKAMSYLELWQKQLLKSASEQRDQ